MSPAGSHKTSEAPAGRQQMPGGAHKRGYQVTSDGWVKFLIVACLALSGCKVGLKPAESATKPTSSPTQGALPSNVSNITAGTFSGELTIGSERATFKEGTALMVTGIDPTNPPRRWLRSFPGAVPNRGVAFAALPGGSSIISGIFHNRIQFDTRYQILNSDTPESLFLITVSPSGRVTAASLIASAEHFSSPVFRQGSGSRIEMETPADVLTEGPGGKSKKSIVFRTTITSDGLPLTTESFEPKQPLTVNPKLCNFCLPDSPRTDANCQACLAQVLNVSGDTFCRDTGWGIQCINEALADGCKPSLGFCSCPHGTGETGGWMHHACTELHYVPGKDGPSDCVSRVDSDNTNCEWSGWDNGCISTNNRDCNGRNL